MTGNMKRQAAGSVVQIRVVFFNQGELKLSVLDNSIQKYANFTLMPDHHHGICFLISIKPLETFIMKSTKQLKPQKRTHAEMKRL